MTDRKRLEDRKNFAQRLGMPTAELFGVTLSIADIQALADRWVEAFYDHQPHRGFSGKTPAQATAEANVMLRTVDAWALDVLLMPVADGGYRKVSKFGVRVEGHHYQTMAALPGDRVFVRMDPADYGLVYLFDADSRAFIELAVCPERAGIDPAEYTALVKRRRTELLAERGKDIRAEVKAITTGPALIEQYLAEKEKAQAAAIDNVVTLPARTVEHTTPDLAAALSAATGERHEAPADAPLVMPEEPAEVVAFTPKATGTGRPAFRSDQELAAWLVANPDRITDRDRALMGERLRSWTFRELCRPLASMPTLSPPSSRPIAIKGLDNETHLRAPFEHNGLHGRVRNHGTARRIGKLLHGGGREAGIGQDLDGAVVRDFERSAVPARQARMAPLVDAARAAGNRPDRAGPFL